MSDYRAIDYWLDDGVATITLSRADRLNALSPLMLDEIALAARRAGQDGARAILLTGAGRAFCSGADLSADAYEDGAVPDDLGVLIDRHYNPMVRAITELDIPVVTAVNGPAVGAGLGLALLGDLVVMARSAYLMLSFVSIGLVPDAGSTWLVARSVGRARALELALLGEEIGADEARAMGLVTRVVADEALLDEATALARRLAAGPTLAVGMIRKQVAAALDHGLDATLDVERHNQSRAGSTADFREAVAAFGEKRKPIFRGF